METIDDISPDLLSLMWTLFQGVGTPEEALAQLPQLAQQHVNGQLPACGEVLVEVEDDTRKSSRFWALWNAGAFGLSYGGLLAWGATGPLASAGVAAGCVLTAFLVARYFNLTYNPRDGEAIYRLMRSSFGIPLAGTVHEGICKTVCNAHPPAAQRLREIAPAGTTVLVGHYALLCDEFNIEMSN